MALAARTVRVGRGAKVHLAIGNVVRCGRPAGSAVREATGAEVTCDRCKALTPLRVPRVLPCSDPFCGCAGQGHDCAGTCATSGECTCWPCVLCGIVKPEDDVSVDEDGRPVGLSCCGHRMDETGKVR